jgi:hypothetical protein
MCDGKHGILYTNTVCTTVITPKSRVSQPGGPAANIWNNTGFVQ